MVISLATAQAPLYFHFWCRILILLFSRYLRVMRTLFYAFTLFSLYNTDSRDINMHGGNVTQVPRFTFDALLFTFERCIFMLSAAWFQSMAAFFYRLFLLSMRGSLHIHFTPPSNVKRRHTYAANAVPLLFASRRLIFIDYFYFMYLQIYRRWLQLIISGVYTKGRISQALKNIIPKLFLVLLNYITFHWLPSTFFRHEPLIFSVISLLFSFSTMLSLLSTISIQKH